MCANFVVHTHAKEIISMQKNGNVLAWQ